MGQTRSPGLIKRGETWHIDKKVRGYGRIRESTGTGQLEEAERFLTRRLEEVRQARVYGVRPDRLFREAATKYLLGYAKKRSIKRDAQELKILDAYIGDLPLRQVHMGTLDSFIEDRKAAGKANGTINRGLAVVRRILNLAARLWRDEFALTWLETAPLIQLLPDGDARQPYPLSWDEQEALFAKLPPHLREMATFKVNSGCRQQEVCKLCWEWEVPIDELRTSVFVIPAGVVKNGRKRLVILNKVGRQVIERQRGKHAKYVFTYEGEGVTKIYNSAWKRARRDLAADYAKVGKTCPRGLASVRVHDLKHTFGRRLRAAGVTLEDREDLLGHKSKRITTHYSSAEIANLIKAANKACERSVRISPTVTLGR